MAYVLPPLDEEIRSAMGDVAFTLTPVFVFESIMPVPYISEIMGMSMESGVAAPRVQAGEILNTVKGDFVIVQHTVIRGGEPVVAQTVQVDVGAGEAQLQTVVSTLPDDDPDAAGDDPPDSGPVQPPAPPPPSDSSLSLPPSADPSVATTVHPDTPAPDDSQYTTGSSASVPTSTGDPYASSGTASATQDLVGYGELDVNGNPVQTASPVLDPGNLSAQYDGI